MSSPKTKAFHRERVPNPNVEGLPSFFEKHLLLSFTCLDKEITASFIWEDKDNHPVCDQTKKKNPLRAHIFHFVFYGRAAVPMQSGEACNLSGFHSNSIVGERLLKKRAVACAGRG